MAKTRLYIYGKGGHSLVIWDLARILGYKDIKFIDDTDIDLGLNIKKLQGDFIIAVGENKTRKRLFKFILNNSRLRPITLIHPSAIISKTSKIGKGSVIMAGAVINAMAKIGKGVIINTGAIIEHECVLGNFSHVSPNATLCGKAVLKKLSWVCAGSIVLPCVKIGKLSILGANSLAKTSIKSKSLAAGTPAKIIKKIHE